MSESGQTLKIGFVYDAVYPWEKGGAQKRVWELARRLADKHEVHLFGMKYWDGPAQMKRDGIIYHGVCEPFELYTEGRRSIKQAVRFAIAVTVPLLKEDLDIVDCQQFPYFPVFPSKAHELLRDSELIVTWYEVWDEYWYEYLGKIGIGGKLIERIVTKIPKTIIPISDYIRDDLQELGRTQGLEVVENGVDYGSLQDTPTATENWDVIYIGRLSEHKRVKHLLQAIEIVSEQIDRDVETCIIGDGPERNDLEQLARSLNIDLHVKFLGFVEADEDVIANMKAATVFVLPSIREGFPNTILEANACGVSSIVVDHPENGGTAVVKDGKTGFITESNPNAIAGRIEEIITNQSLRNQLSEAAEEYGKSHDWSKIVRDLEEVYLSNVSENRQ